MQFEGIQIIVFDLDDTLCPEREFVKSGFRAVADWLLKTGVGKQDFFSDMWQLFCGGTHERVFNRVLDNASIEYDNDLIQRLIDVYRTHMPAVKLYPDAALILDYYHARVKLGLLSDGYLVSQKNKFKTLTIECFFDIVVFTDELGRKYWKPHTAGFEKIMHQFGLEGKSCLYVGDNPLKDFIGPRKLGWQTVMVMREDGVYRQANVFADNAGPDAVIYNLDELKPIVGL